MGNLLSIDTCYAIEKCKRAGGDENQAIQRLLESGMHMTDIQRCNIQETATIGHITFTAMVDSALSLRQAWPYDAVGFNQLLDSTP